MFAFSQIEPNATGYLDKPKIPLSRFLGAAWDQGVHDSMGASVFRISEQMQMEGDLSLWGTLDQQAGRTLSADEASAQYGTQRLRFTEPVREGTARLLRERHDENERRNYLLSEGASSLGRVAGSFGVSMLASMANPVDFSLMFFPAVGSEMAAGKLAALGVGSIRRGLARGLVTEESLAGLAAPRVLAAAIDGVIGQAVAEVPLYISNRMDQTPYTMADSVTNIALGGAFAAGLRLALTGAGRLLQKLSGDTKEAAARKAASDFLAGKDIEVHKLVELDEAVIREKVVFDATTARAEALKRVDAKLIETEAWARARLDVEGTVGRVDQPNLLKIAEDWIPIYEAQGKPVAMLKKLLETAKAAPTVLNLQNLASQFDLTFDPVERSFPGLYYIPPDPERVRMQRVAGVADDELLVPGRVSNEQRRKQVEEIQLQKELKIRKLVEEEKERRVKAYVEQLRKEFNPEQETRRRVNEETLRQQNEGRVLTEEQAAKYVPGETADDSDIAVLEKDIEELKKSLDIKDEEPQTPKGEEGGEEKKKTAVDHIVAVLEGLKIEETDGPKYYSGIPPEIWNAFINFVIAGVREGERLYAVVEGILRTMRKPDELLHELDAVNTLVRWSEEGVGASESGESLTHEDVTKAAYSLLKYAKPMTVYRAATRNESRSVGGWSDKRASAETYGARFHPSKGMQIQEFKAKKVVSNATLLELLDKHGLMDEVEQTNEAFIAEEEAFVLDFIIGEKQIDEIRAKFYDTTAELRPAAMLSPDELKAEAKPAIIASVSEKGTTARGRFHGFAYDNLSKLLGAEYNYDNNWDYMRGREGFITVNQRHVTREEMQALTGESESFAMAVLKDAKELGDKPVLERKKVQLEWERREAVELELTDAGRAGRWLRELDMEIRSIDDQLEAIDKAARYQTDLDVYHKSQLDLHIDVSEPVNKAAWDKFHKEPPAGYEHHGDFYVPTGKMLSQGLSERLLLDHLERCMIK